MHYQHLKAFLFLILYGPLHVVNFRKISLTSLLNQKCSRDIRSHRELNTMEPCVENRRRGQMNPLLLTTMVTLSFRMALGRR